MSKNNQPPKAAGNERNEYIPSFISKAPFFAENLIDNDADWLSHQRLQSASNDTLDKAKWYDRGRKAGPAATKFRKGACENCGAMTHKTKECLSRPRKQGAKWSGKDIQADEVIDDVKLGWDAKRDRWNGYDAREYDAVVRDYQDLESLKAANESKETDSNGLNDDLEQDEAERKADDAARYGEETDMGRNQPTSTRQLRLREDTAKYLLNLDLDSAKYDPKTRSMDTTAQNLEKSGANGDDIASDGFVRPSNTSDDAAAFERAQKYAWESQDNKSSVSGNQKLHLQANPTEGEVLMKKRETESAAKKAASRRALVEKYGGEEYMQQQLLNDNDDQTTMAATASKPSLIASSEAYAEYDPDTGRVKPKHNQPEQIKPVARSKYPEDQYPNNHSSVFGSWWHNFTWGYACCHSTVKNSYCTGEEGKRAFEEAEEQKTGRTLQIQTQVSGVEEGTSRKRELDVDDSGGFGSSKKSKTSAMIEPAS